MTDEETYNAWIARRQLYAEELLNPNLSRVQRGELQAEIAQINRLISELENERKIKKP